MFGTISDKREVNVPAIEAWKVYGTLQLSKMVVQSLPNSFSKIDVLQGDGSSGTIVEVFFPPGAAHGMTSFKEKYAVVDDSKMVKQTEIIEGGHLDLGITRYGIRFEVIEKEDKNWCITKSTIEYEVKEVADANACIAFIKEVTFVMEAVAHHLINNYNKNTSQN